jgi:hypothetical protein
MWMEFDAELVAVFISLAANGWSSAKLTFRQSKLVCDTIEITIPRTSVPLQTSVLTSVPLQISVLQRLAGYGLAVRCGINSTMAALQADTWDAVVSWAAPLRWDRDITSFTKAWSNSSVITRGQYHTAISGKVVFRQMRVLFQPLRKSACDLPLPARKLLMDFCADAAAINLLDGSRLRSMSLAGQNRQYAKLDEELQREMMAAACKGQTGLVVETLPSWMEWMEANNYAYLKKHFKKAGLLVDSTACDWTPSRTLRVRWIPS